MAKSAPDPAANRLASLDAYRGFTMLAMASAGLGMSKLKSDPAWASIADQFEHREWVGCTFWDLIQPSFMFIVGVSMVYSYNARISQGQAWPRQMLHAVKRAVLLCFVGIFLDCFTADGGSQLHVQFIRVLQQIAIGYLIVFLVLPLGPKAQGVAAVLLLAGHTAAFLVYGHVTGNPPWDKELNIGREIDKLLHLPLSRHHYVTFNAISSAGTILFGVLAGELLRSALDPAKKFFFLVAAGAVGLLAGWALSGGGGWVSGLELPVAVPMIKKLWTSSFAIFAAGWTCWMLAMFYLLMDAAEWKLWAFPFVVVGMNSIAMYVLSQMFRNQAARIVNIFIPIDTNTGDRVLDYLPWIDLTNLTWHMGVDVRGQKLLPVVASLLTLLVLWAVVYWLYRRKIFFKL